MTATDLHGKPANRGNNRAAGKTSTDDTLNYTEHTGEEERSERSESSTRRHLRECVRLLQQEAEERNGGNNAIGCDKVALAFSVRSADLHHPDVRWVMYDGGVKQNITAERLTFSSADVGNSEMQPAPPGDHPAVRHVLPPPASPPLDPVDRSVDAALARVRARAAKREAPEQPPITKYLGKLQLSRRCQVRIEVSYGVSFCDAVVTFNPARLHDPEGTSLCPPYLVEAYSTLLLQRLAGAGILVRECPHLHEAEGGFPASNCDCGAAVHDRNVASRQPDGVFGFVCDCVPCRDGNSPERIAEDRRLEAKFKALYATGRYTKREARDEAGKPPGLLTGVRLSQFDLTVDFVGVRDRSVYFDIMRASPHYAKKPAGSKTYKTTVLLRTGDGGWELIGYDKNAETLAKRQGARAADGTFRFEVRLPRRVLAYEGVRSVGDLTAEQCMRLFMKGLGKAGLDRAVGGQPPVRRRVLPSVGALRTRRLYHRLDVAAVGDLWDVGDAKTEREYRRIASQHGLVLGRPARGLGPHRYLDPVSGRELRPSDEWMHLHQAHAWRRRVCV